MKKWLRAFVCVSVAVGAVAFGVMFDARPVFADSGENEYTSYVVKRGDTLWDIAERFLGDGRRYSEIAADNNVTNPRLIFPGQRFLIRSAAETRTPAEIIETQQAAIRELEAHHQSTTALYEQHAVVLARENKEARATIAAQQDEAAKLRAAIFEQEAHTAALADYNETLMQDIRFYEDSVTAFEAALKHEEDLVRELRGIIGLVSVLSIILVILTMRLLFKRERGKPKDGDSEALQVLTKERDEARAAASASAERLETLRKERDTLSRATGLLENPAELVATLSPDALVAVLKLAKPCPYCSEAIEAKNYVRHVESRCAKKPSLAPAGTASSP